MEQGAEAEEEAELKFDEEKYGNEDYGDGGGCGAGVGSSTDVAPGTGKASSTVADAGPSSGLAGPADVGYGQLLRELGVEEGSTVGSRFAH